MKQFAKIKGKKRGRRIEFLKKFRLELQIPCSFFNPHTPVAQKIADEVVFRRFQGEGVEFF